MDQVGGVEKLSHSGIDVLLGFIQSVRTILDFRVVWIVEVQIFGVRTVVVNPIIPAFPVLMGKDLQSKK